LVAASPAHEREVVVLAEVLLDPPVHVLLLPLVLLVVPALHAELD
jgi:hypothetical protein